MGDPPFVGDAVKVTLVPAQIVLELAAILTLGVTFGVKSIPPNAKLVLAKTGVGQFNSNKFEATLSFMLIICVLITLLLIAVVE